MRLGIIGWINESDFAKAKEKKLEFIELDVNERSKEFFENIETIQQYSKKYDMPISAIGRWGSERIHADGINKEELDIECALIEAAQKLGAKVYITGCNYIESLSYFENCQLAIQYFEKLIAYGKKAGVRIATYNCRWNNFVYSAMAWTMIHGYLKDLYIKYDTSHCIYDGGDYLQETVEWGDRFAYVHIKGSLQVNGKRVDDPPAGIDQTNWPAFMALLYAKGYQGDLSIEPHSETWKGILGESGVDFTIHFVRQLMFDQSK